jgi:hypothetical protein
MKEKQLTEFFVEHGVLQASQAEDVLDEVELNGKTVPQAMIDGGFIDELGFLSDNRKRAGHRLDRPERTRHSAGDFTFDSQWAGSVTRRSSG